MDSGTLSRRRFIGSAVRGGAVLVALPVVPGAFAFAGARLGAGGAGGGAGAGAGGGETRGGGGPDPDLARRVLERALARGGDFADLYWQRSTVEVLELEDDEVGRAVVTVRMGTGVRVVQGDRTGHAYTEEATPEALMAAAGTASLIARGAAGAVSGRLAPVAVAGRYAARTVMTEVDVSSKVAMLRRANATARRADPRVERVQVLLQDVLDEVVVYTSDGRISADARPRAGLLVSVVAARNGRRERASYHRGGRRGAEFFTDSEVDAIATEAVRRTVVLFEAVTPPAGTMPVVLAPGSSGILLHEAIGHGLEADFARKRVSVYADRVGQRVCSELCTIVDDGTIEGDSGQLRFDDEGTPTERTVLIEKGVLRSYMHDRMSAAAMAMRPTGNGRRESYRHIVVPRMRTTYMEPGPHSPEEILRSVDRGIYAVAFSNGQVEIGGGDFSFYVSLGYLIEKGKVTAPIKDVNLIGNGPEVLSRVTMVGSDLAIEPGGFGHCGKRGQQVPVGFGLPHVKVSAIAVGGVEGRA